MDSELVLYRGLPGSGKTTAAKLSGLPVVEADDFFTVHGVYLFDKRRISDAHEWCKATAKRHLFCGASIAVANTATRRWEVAEYQKIADQYGAEFRVVVCSGKWENCHGVPDEIVKRMKARWEKWGGEEMLK